MATMSDSAALEHPEFWRRAAELREATRGRKVTPSEELIRKDRDRDFREGSRHALSLEAFRR